MITHRVTTKLAPEPPVGFYRTIAVSFLIITLALLGVIIFFTSKKATIVVVAKTDNKNINIDINVDRQKTGGLSIAGLVTTTEFGWSQKYFPTGTKTTKAPAIGLVILHNDTNAVQPLVKTTRLITPEGVMFRLSDRVVVPAHGQVSASVYADEPGESGNIGPSRFIIPGLSDEKQKVIYATSDKSMSGGVKTIGVLAESDLKAAELDYVEKAKQMIYDSLDDRDSFDQKLVFISDYHIEADRKAGEEVAEFNLTGTSTAVVVYYSGDELKSILSKETSNRIDAGFEKVLSVSREPQVSLSNYDLEKQKSRLSVYQDVLVTLDANADKLAAANFFGKSKDEIERHILGLGHVIGVDVKFSPSWMRSAPSVSDRIQVVVKNVQ